MRKQSRRIYAGFGFGLAALWMMCAAANAAESRSYVVSSLIPAANFQDADCPGGKAPDSEQSWRQGLSSVGLPQKEVDDLLELAMDGRQARTDDALTHRGMIDGARVNVYVHPRSVPNPAVVYSASKRTYGFNLNGVVETGADAFEDPETKEAGVDNQWARATGCINPLTSPASASPASFAFAWKVQQQAAAMIMTITAEDFSKDGPATLSFSKSFDTVSSDANSGVRSYSTFRPDPDPRWKGSFEGHIKDGVFTSDGAEVLSMKTVPFYMAGQLVLKAARMRLDLRSPQLKGYVAGYEDWKDLYSMFGMWGLNAETLNVVLPQLYQVLSEKADFDPDPVTGKNRAISITYRLEAVPAFIVPAMEGDRRMVSQAEASHSR
jgi:hypothetical protein